MIQKVSTATRVGLVAACRFPAPRGSQVLIDEMAGAFQQGGVETHLIAPLHAELRRPYRVHALLRRTGLAPPADPSAFPRFARLLFDAGLAARLHGVVRRERLQVVHAHNYEGLIAALLVRGLRRVPVVFHCHALLGDELPHYAPSGAAVRRAARRFGEWCDRTLPRLADHVVALSDDVARHLAARGVARERLSVVPPGIRPEPFAARGARRDRRAIFAGNLDRVQNLGLLLDAWAVATRGDPSLELAVVTEAPRIALAAMLARRSLADTVRVVPAGSLGEVAAELARASVGVSPRSSWSGFPIKNLNYMASGLATVALAGSAKGVRDGETGRVVREASATALGEALRESLSDPIACARQGRAARGALDEMHAWSRLVPALIEVAERARERRA